LLFQQGFLTHSAFSVMNLRVLTLMAALAALLCAPAAHAQFELKGGATNLLDMRKAGASPNVSNGLVNTITVRGGGSGYSSAPTVTIAAPASGTTATATATITAFISALPFDPNQPCRHHSSLCFSNKVSSPIPLFLS
jgi:hypothetical protein